MDSNILGFKHMIALIIIFLFGFFLIEKYADESVDTSQQNTISVTGTAERFVAPDTASVSFSMTRKSFELSEATESVNSRIARLLESLDEDGVEESDIKTTSYNVNPQYQYNEGARTFDGYRVTQSLEITIKDLDAVNSVLTKIGELDVDNVSGLSFFVDNDKEIKKELREEAIDNAKQEAKDLARDLGVGLGDVVSFNEPQSQFYPQPFATRSFALDESVSSSAVIPTGENQMTSEVVITYSID